MGWFFVPMIIAFGFYFSGSVLDLSFSQAIADQNSWFGVFVEGWGMMIVFGFGVVAGAAVLAGALQFKKKGWTIFGVIMFIAAMAVMTYESGAHILNEFGGNPWLRNMGAGGIALGYGISFIVMSAFALPCFLVFRKADAKTAVTMGLFVLGLMAVSAFAMEFSKMCAYRPRYRWLFGYTYDANGNYVLAPAERANLYRRWFDDWQWFNKSKYSDPSNPVYYAPNSDYIKSFPSGHTGFFAVTMLFPGFLPLFGMKEEKLRIWQPITFVIAALATYLVGFARILVGAHWLSDVSVAVTITTGLSTFGIFFINFLQKHNYFQRKKEPKEEA